MKVLIVSHSQNLSQAISSILTVRWPNLSLFHVHEAREAVQLIRSVQPHIAMLHLPERSEGAPPLDYLELISQIRIFSDVSLIVISQSDDVTDKMKALETGADDWVSPSFTPRNIALLRHLPEF
jgi:DNA-binding response OmpR family regulator